MDPIRSCRVILLRIYLEAYLHGGRRSILNHYFLFDPTLIRLVHIATLLLLIDPPSRRLFEKHALRSILVHLLDPNLMRQQMLIISCRIYHGCGSTPETTLSHNDISL